MIKLVGINKSYSSGSQKLHVLKGINLHIKKGEMVAIMGSSGSGKSTLLNILGTLDNYEEGDYIFEDHLIKDMNEHESALFRNSNIGFIFQSFNLIQYKNALENVALPLYYRKMKEYNRNQIALEYLNLVGLKDWWHHKPSQLSGGQQQRVAIARALVSTPKLVLADEPTGALDSSTTEEIMTLLNKLNIETNTTMIIVTHDHNVASMTNRIIEIKDGYIY